MGSFGARFSDDEYIKVDIDFESGESAVTMITETDGTPNTVTGEITWDIDDSDDIDVDDSDESGE